MEVLQRTANRGSISTGSYEIDNSVKLEDANSEWFYRASPTAGNRRTYTFSFWVKRTEIGTVNASGNQFVIGQGQHGRMYFGGDYFQYRFDDGHDCRNVSRQFRDTSAWYHFVVAVDTNQSSASNRVKLYVNGESLAVDDHDGGSFPDIQDEGAFFSTSYLTLGTAPFGGSYNVGDGDYDMSGYLAEFCAVDGQQLTPTDFGEFDSDSGIWKPINVSGINFGNQGFYLNFATAGDLGDDKSGNGKDLTENNLAAADQSTDTPTNNFATGNPLMPLKANTILTNGATNFKNVGTAGWAGFASSIAVQSGKWYVEFTAAGATTMCGVGNVNDFLNSIYYGNWNTSIGFYGTAGLLFIDGSTSGAGPNNTWTGLAYGDGDIVGIALDKDNGCVYMSKNGTFANSGDPTSGASKTGGVELTKGNSDYSASDYFYIGASQDINNGILQANYGGYTTDTPSSAASDANGYGTFEYAPPTGYYALCTKNLAEYG